MKREYDFSKGKRGALIPQPGKTRISIFIDNVILDAFRARARKAGTGYQTMMNEALRAHLSEDRQPITEQVLRNVLRQEIPEYLRATKPRAAKRGTKSTSAAANPAARKFIGSDDRPGDVARHTKRLIRERFRG